MTENLSLSSEKTRTFGAPRLLWVVFAEMLRFFAIRVKTPPFRVASFTVKVKVFTLQVTTFVTQVKVFTLQVTHFTPQVTPFTLQV